MFFQKTQKRGIKRRNALAASSLRMLRAVNKHLTCSRNIIRVLSEKTRCERRFHSYCAKNGDVGCVFFRIFRLNMRLQTRKYRRKMSLCGAFERSGEKAIDNLRRTC